jgi:hypothetical protein
MTFDPWLAQRMAQERMQDALRKAHRVQLIGTAQPSRVTRIWHRPRMKVLSRLLSLSPRGQRHATFLPGSS